MPTFFFSLYGDVPTNCSSFLSTVMEVVLTHPSLFSSKAITSKISRAGAFLCLLRTIILRKSALRLKVQQWAGKGPAPFVFIFGLWRVSVETRQALMPCHICSGQFAQCNIFSCGQWCMFPFDFTLRHMEYALLGAEHTIWTPCLPAVFFSLRVTPWMCYPFMLLNSC